MRFVQQLFIATTIISISAGFSACSAGTMGEERDVLISGYKVIYNSNYITSGNVPVDNENYDEGDMIIVQGNPGRLINGDQCLKGWYVVEEGSETIYKDGDLYKMGNKNLTFTALWKTPTPGDVDTTFEPATDVIYIYTMAIQSNGKILIGGDFEKYDGVAINSIARLNATGSLDTTFNPGTGPDDVVRNIVVQDDGKILIYGDFKSYNGYERNRLARLYGDGSLDKYFNPGTGPESTSPYDPILSIALQSDRKILIGGYLTSYNGITINHIARLNASGSLDTTFNPGSGPNSYVSSIVVQKDGKIYIGGQFWTYNGVSSNAIARLNDDGSLDATFASAHRQYDYVFSISTQNDGKIITNGDFYNESISKRTTLYRLNSNGSLDTSFSIGLYNGYVDKTAIQNDGKIIVVGDFIGYSSVDNEFNCIARLNTSGSLDTSFDPGVGPMNLGSSGYISDVIIQSNGKILIKGSFNIFKDILRPGIVRVWN